MNSGQNPMKSEYKFDDLNVLLNDWDYFIANTQDTLILMQNAGEKNDGEQRQMGTISITELIELAQVKLKQDKHYGQITESDLKKAVDDIK